jgi:hypothetical protein
LYRSENKRKEDAKVIGSKRGLRSLSSARWPRVVFVLNLVAVLLASCGGSRLMGKWTVVSTPSNELMSCLATALEGDEVEFLQGGTLVVPGGALGLKILDGRHFRCDGPFGLSYVDEYQIEGDTLTLTDEQGREWTLVRNSGN